MATNQGLVQKEMTFYELMAKLEAPGGPESFIVVGYGQPVTCDEAEKLSNALKEFDVEIRLVEDDGA